MYRGSFFLQGKRNYEYTPAGFLLQPLQSSFLFSLFSLPLDWTIWAEHQTPSGSAGRTGHWVGRPAMALPPPKLSSWLTHDHHSDKDQEMIQELSPHGSDTAMTMIWQYAKWINLCEMIRPRSLYGRSWSQSSSSPWLSSSTHYHHNNNWMPQPPIQSLWRIIHTCVLEMPNKVGKLGPKIRQIFRDSPTMMQMCGAAWSPKLIWSWQ